jgi:hypothetical protein
MKTGLWGMVAAGLITSSGWANPPVIGPNLSGNLPVPPWAAPGASSFELSKQNPDQAVLMDEKKMAAATITPPSAPMPAYDLQTLPDRTYRELDESVAVRKLLAPCVLFTRDLKDSAQLQALGAPISPIFGESASEAHQARFPLFIIAW